jgi:hypothetical protein
MPASMALRAQSRALAAGDEPVDGDLRLVVLGTLEFSALISIPYRKRMKRPSPGS